MSIAIYHTAIDLGHLGNVHAVVGFELEHETRTQYESVAVIFVDIFLPDVESPITITESLDQSSIMELEDEIIHHSFLTGELESRYGQLESPVIDIPGHSELRRSCYRMYEL